MRLACAKRTASSLLGQPDSPDVKSFLRDIRKFVHASFNNSLAKNVLILLPYLIRHLPRSSTSNILPIS